MSAAGGEFQIAGWEPTDWDTAEGATLGRVTVRKTFAGELTGDSVAELLTVHDGAGQPAVYVGVERVRGAIGGRSGTFVLHHTAPGTAGEPVVIRIVPGTGTGELAGITGALAITGDVEGGHTYRLDYELG